MRTESAPSSAADGTDDFMPVPVVDLELTSPLSTPRTNELGQVLALVRIHGVPLGTLSRLVPAGNLDEDLYISAVDQFRDQIVEHLAQDGEPTADLHTSLAASAKRPCASAAAESSRRVSVVVCTLGQDPRLVGTVESILGQRHDQLELIVVDNDPGSGRVAAALSTVTDSRVRIVAEPRRGLSVARNTGWAAASHSLVAYTDDDAIVDPGWLTELIRPFEHPAVACVTGLVLPAELATPAQLLFEEFGAFDKGFRRAVWSNDHGQHDLTGLGPTGDGGVLFPYSAGVFGSGNNMAFRVEWLSRHGGFDVALGAGTLSRGGEDLDAFLKVMLADAVIVYEPRAVVRHYARSDMAALRSQMYGYGSGMSAVIAKHLVSSPRHALRILARLPAGLRKLLDPSSDKNKGKSRTFPKELSDQELRGYLAGPVLYARSRVAARRHGLYAPSVPAELVGAGS